MFIGIEIYNEIFYNEMFADFLPYLRFGNFQMKSVALLLSDIKYFPE